MGKGRWAIQEAAGLSDLRYELPTKVARQVERYSPAVQDLARRTTAQVIFKWLTSGRARSFPRAADGTALLPLCHRGRWGHCPACDVQKFVVAGAAMYDAGLIERHFVTSMPSATSSTMSLLHANGSMLDYMAALALAVPQTKDQVPRRVFGMPSVSTHEYAHCHLAVIGNTDPLIFQAALTSTPTLVGSYGKDGGSVKHEPEDQIRLGSYILSQIVLPTDLSKRASPILRWKQTTKGLARARADPDFLDRVQHLKDLRAEHRIAFLESRRGSGTRVTPPRRSMTDAQAESPLIALV